jgi:hypothetical protein
LLLRIASNTVGKKKADDICSLAGDTSEAKLLICIFVQSQH